MSATLGSELERLGAVALVALGGEGDDPDHAPFAGAAKLGEAFVVTPRGGAPRLAFLTPMERDEAAATGLALLAPETLDVARLTREHTEPGARLAVWLAKAVRWSGVAPGRVALAAPGRPGRWSRPRASSSARAGASSPATTPPIPP